jgi:hypothetical protein
MEYTGWCQNDINIQGETRPLLRLLLAPVHRDLARGGTAISAENDSNGREITVQIPEELQPLPANGSVE